MEGYYGVYFGKELAGKVQVLRQGLYYRFICRCKLTGNVVCRLNVTCGAKSESLGVVIPMDGGFGLDTKLAVKRLGEGEMSFCLMPKHEVSKGTFAAIYPDEPFAYIERLKESFLVRKNGEYGIYIQQVQGRE